MTQSHNRKEMGGNGDSHDYLDYVAVRILNFFLVFLQNAMWSQGDAWQPSPWPSVPSP